MKTKLTSLAGAFLLIGCAGLCSADTMTYSTTGYFTGGSATLNFGDGNTITFDPLSSTTITVPGNGSPGNLAYGMFDTNGVSSTTSTVPNGESFTLTVTQTAPTMNGFTDTASVTGTISNTGSTIRILFPTTTFALGPDTFTIAQPPDGFVIVAPSNNNGFTTINGTVSLSPAPEPSTMLLFGAGLVSLSLIGRKRRA